MLKMLKLKTCLHFFYVIPFLNSNSNWGFVWMLIFGRFFAIKYPSKFNLFKFCRGTFVRIFHVKVSVGFWSMCLAGSVPRYVLLWWWLHRGDDSYCGHSVGGAYPSSTLSEAYRPSTPHPREPNTLLHMENSYECTSTKFKKTDFRRIFYREKTPKNQHPDEPSVAVTVQKWDYVKKCKKVLRFSILNILSIPIWLLRSYVQNSIF